MTVKRFKNILDKIHNGDASLSEKMELDDCMDSEKFEEISMNAWNDASEESVSESLRNELWNNINAVISETESGKKSDAHSSAFNYKNMFKVAVSVVILCIGIMAYMLFDKAGTPLSDGGRVAFNVEPGQKGNLCLPDGTMVYLNSASKITLDVDYNVEERIVNLSGEAFFEVAKDPSRRFVVICNGVEVEALGTKFNVKAYPADSVVTTTLSEGKVKVYNDRQSVTLLPNGVATYDLKENSLKSHIVEDVMVANYWRTGHLVYHSEPMSFIAKTIERMYNVKINIQDKKLLDMRFTGTIQNNSLTNVLYIMSLSYPLTYTIDGSEITISKLK